MAEAFFAILSPLRRSVPRALLRWTLFLFANLTAAQTWTEISWIGVPDGRIASIAVDPTDSSHWLAGFGNGGVWETHDGGGSWLPLSDNWPTLATGAIAFAPGDSRTIYVGTGEADVGNVGHSGVGVMKSIDAGKTWTLLGAANFARSSVKRIRVHPTNANIVLAATTRSGMGRDAWEGVPSSPAFGVLRSTDGGVTWTRTLTGQATALEIDPTNFNNQYAAIGDQRYPNGDNNDSKGEINGIYRSTDGGQTWAVISGPWGSTSATASSVGRVELAISPSQPGTFYASIQVPPNGGPSNTGLLGLYRTDNAWAPAPTWIQIPVAASEEYCNVEHMLGTGTTTFKEGKCGYSHVISVDPSDANTLFAGGVDLWRCTNCGKSPSWTDIDATVAHPGAGDYHALVWLGSRLICGSDHTISSSTDSGQTWQLHSTGLSTMTFYSGAAHSSKPGAFLTGVRDLAGVALRSESAGWQQVIGQESIGVGEAEVAISSTRADTNWMGAAIYGAISRTVDGGQSWIEADAGIDKNGAAFVAPVRKCPSNDNIFLTATYRLWRTDNFFGSSPPTWAVNGPQSSLRDPVYGLPPSVLEIEFIASDTTCNTYVYGNRLGQVQLTRDGGKTWVDLDPGKTLPSRPVNGLALDPTNPNVMYAAFSSFDDATPGQPGHVFRTTNALVAPPTWVNVSPALNQPFNVIRVDPTNSRLIYAGSDTGLWHSTDGAVTWVHDGPQVGLPNASVYDIKINPATGTTAAFTYGRGAYVLGPGLMDGSAVNGATYFPDRLVAGSWASVSGTNLAGTSRTWADGDFAGLGRNLPVKLSGVQLTVNGVAAAVYYVSPTQINFQVPAVATGAATVQVLRDGVPSNTIQTQVVASSPGIFPLIVNGTNYPAGVFLDGSITGDPANGSSFRKARAGDVIQLYATGLAPSPAGTTVGFQALSGVTVTIGSVTVPADAAGLVAAGEFQINFTVSQQFASMPEGNYPITIQVNGVSSPMNINSKPPVPVVLPILH
jgi:uncharacterized protein (TIGR03437 family)